MIIFVTDKAEGKLEKITEIYGRLEGLYGGWGLALMLSVLILLIVQLMYYLCYYGLLPKFRNRKGTAPADEPVSVIVILHEDFHYLETTLPAIMAQRFGQFELVVVDVGGSEEFSDELEMLKARFPNLTVTAMKSDPRFPIGSKMAYNVGIKAAQYDRLILTTADARPATDRWLEYMGRGFASGEVVLGYCGMEPGGGFARKMIRCDRLMLSVRYLAAAVKGCPYRGILQNLGFTKEIYFAHKGFNHLNMNIGEDDLFVNLIADRDNTAVIMNPKAAVLQSVWNDGWWSQERRLRGATFKYYPRRARVSATWELASRFLFFLAVAACIALLPLEAKLGAAVLLILRGAAVSRQMWRIRRRLGERGLAWSMVLYDFGAPVYEAWIAVRMKIRPEPGIYR